MRGQDGVLAGGPASSSLVIPATPTRPHPTPARRQSQLFPVREAQLVPYATSRKAGALLFLFLFTLGREKQFYDPSNQ